MEKKLDFGLNPDSHGDAIFRQLLPGNLLIMGTALLAKIRERFQGMLKYHPAMKMFVETPLNFYTLTIRPRKNLIAVTIYGRPEKYADIEHPFTLAVCRSSYSWFEVSNASEFNAVLRLLERAHEIAQTKRSRKSIRHNQIAG